MSTIVNQLQASGDIVQMERISSLQQKAASFLATSSVYYSVKNGDNDRHCSSARGNIIVVAKSCAELQNCFAAQFTAAA